jgi:hypothetical protein
VEVKKSPGKKYRGFSEVTNFYLFQVKIKMAAIAINTVAIIMLP